VRGLFQVAQSCWRKRTADIGIARVCDVILISDGTYSQRLINRFEHLLPAYWAHSDGPEIEFHSSRYKNGVVLKSLYDVLALFWMCAHPAVTVTSSFILLYFGLTIMSPSTCVLLPWNRRLQNACTMCGTIRSLTILHSSPQSLGISKTILPTHFSHPMSHIYVYCTVTSFANNAFKITDNLRL